MYIHVYTLSIACIYMYMYMHASCVNDIYMRSVRCVIVYSLALLLVDDRIPVL